MPIYEFECGSCGNHFDRLQKLSDPDPANCPECGKPTVKRCVTAPSFRLAGSGWYETDFKKDGDKKRNLVDKGEAKPDNKLADATAASAKPADGASAESKPKPVDKSKPGAETKPAVKAEPVARK